MGRRVTARSECLGPPGYRVRVGSAAWLRATASVSRPRGYPGAAATRLARVHFWLHNLVLPMFMGTLALFRLGQAQLLPVLIAASLAMFAALALFAWNVLVNVKATTAGT